MVKLYVSHFQVLLPFLFFVLVPLPYLLRNLPAFSNSTISVPRISYWGSATVGSLAFCFSDSFWFNAVEAEVYAMAMLFLAILFWLALRWEKDMSNPKGNKWLVLMSLVMGLSFGVHFMALLAIPTIGMVYYFKNYPKTTTKGFLLANAISIAILLFIFKLLLPNTLAFFGKTEVFFVNSLRLPFNSGTIFAGLLNALLFDMSKIHGQEESSSVEYDFSLFAVSTSWVFMLDNDPHQSKCQYRNQSK